MVEVTLKAGARELTGITLNSLLPAFAKQNDGAAISDPTMAEALGALLHKHARAICHKPES
jgi:hypothetical protein